LSRALSLTSIGLSATTQPIPVAAHRSAPAIRAAKNTKNGETTSGKSANVCAHAIESGYSPIHHRMARVNPGAPTPM
jgi:hypothetical protein